MARSNQGKQALDQALLLLARVEMNKGASGSSPEDNRRILEHISVAMGGNLAAPEEAKARYVRGCVYLTQGKLEEAESDVLKALQLDSALENPHLLYSAWDTLKEIADQRGNRAGAIEYLEKGIKALQSTYGLLAKTLIGETHCQLSLLIASDTRDLPSAKERALRHATTALAKAPNYPVTHFALGAIYSDKRSLTQEYRDLAISSFESYLRMVGPSTSVKTEENRWSEIARQGVAHLRREGNNPQPIQRGNGGGCFITTAVYGDIDHPDVRILRDFRDEVLSASIRGR